MPGGRGTGLEYVDETVGGGEEIIVAGGGTDAAEMVFDADAGHAATVDGGRCGVCTGETILSCETWEGIPGVAVWWWWVHHG